jgi:beta-phosphoglucomutase
MGMKPDYNINTKTIKAIFFDMDGVLVDSMNYHRDSWRELLHSFGVDVSDQFIFEHEGAMSPEVIKNLFIEQGYPIDSKEIPEIYARQNEKFLHDFLPLVGLYPESLPLLEGLRKKELQLGLVTGSRRNLIEKIWKPEELELFSTIVAADDTERFKPNPDPYLKAVQAIGQPLENCLVVENAPAGIQAALSAGITCYAVASTLPHEKLSMADQVFPNLASLTIYFNTVLL